VRFFVERSFGEFSLRVTKREPRLKSFKKDLTETQKGGESKKPQPGTSLGKNTPESNQNHGKG